MRIPFSLLCIALSLSSSGCVMCQSCGDDAFCYQGGSWMRDNPCRGRVGSAFEPAGSRVMSAGYVEEGSESSDVPMEMESDGGSEAVPMPEVDVAPESVPQLDPAPQARSHRNPARRWTSQKDYLP